MGNTPVRLVVVDARAGAEQPERDLTSLFRDYSSYVARIALRLLGRDDEIDDVIQDVFLEAVRGLGTVREPAAIKGWLATVTVRVASRKLRIRKLRRWVGLDRAPEPLFAASQEHGVFLAEVYRALDGFPVPERVAWIMRHVEGCSLDEVAVQCGCSLATAKRRIAAAHRRLEEVLEP